MLEIASNKPIPSKLYDGVIYVIRVMSEGTRTRVMIRAADALKKLRHVQSELASLPVIRDAEGKVREDQTPDPAVMAQVSNLSDETSRIHRTELDPIYLSVCFVGVTGVSINGKSGTEITADYFTENAHEKMFGELMDAIRAEVELSDEEKQNLESPTTSTAPVVGKINDLPADTAGDSKINSTPLEIADTSQTIGTPTETGGGAPTIE